MTFHRRWVLKHIFFYVLHIVIDDITPVSVVIILGTYKQLT